MRIMFVHNKYACSSGEERMIERIIALLQQNGHDVEAFYKDSASIQTSLDKVNAFASGVWSRSAAKEFERAINDFKPDIVQIQNLFPLISPSVLSIAKQARIPVVMRLSNYRLLCPNGLLMTKGEICSKCLGGKEYWCVMRNCEGNIVKSFGYALRSAVARSFRFYSSGVTKFYAQTEFQRRLHVEGGFPPDRIEVIPNFLANSETQPLNDGGEGGSYVGYAGRLSSEKGVDLLLEVADGLPSVPFRFAGNPGPYLNKALPANVKLCGHLSGVQLSNFYRNCRMIVLPSTWYEGFPGVALDAMGSRKPVVGSRLGGIPEIVDHEKTGLLCTPSNVEEFSEAIEALWRDTSLSRQLGEAGFEKLSKEYTSAEYYKKLMAVYENALVSAQEII